MLFHLDEKELMRDIVCVAAGVIGPLVLYAAHDDLRGGVLNAAQIIGTSYNKMARSSGRSGLVWKNVSDRNQESDVEKAVL